MHSRLTIPELIAKKGFEISKDRPVAIWLGGFHEAFARAEKIAQWLDGDRDALTVLNLP